MSRRVVVLVSGEHKSWVILVAAGSGSRFGADKQRAQLAGEEVLERSLRTAADSADGVVLVVGASNLGHAQTLASHVAGTPVMVCGGGSTRSESVRAGLAAVPETVEFVLVHDGARPLATSALYRRVLDRLRCGAVAVVPAVDVVDSLRERTGVGVDRSRLVAVQTPQGFSRAALGVAHAAGFEASDDAGLMDAVGFEVELVDGETTNLKITNPVDLAIAETLVRLLEGPDEPTEAGAAVDE